MSHNKVPFWKSNMEIMVPRSMSSSNIDYSHKTFCNVLLIVQMWDVYKKKCKKYSHEGRHFPSHISWFAPCKSNVEAMVTNNMWYSLKYASIWMMILRNRGQHAQPCLLCIPMNHNPKLDLIYYWYVDKCGLIAGNIPEIWFFFFCQF